MMRDDKRKKKTVPIRRDMNSNSLIAGIDLGDRVSLATLLTPRGDVADRFCFQMDNEHRSSRNVSDSLTIYDFP